jgi:hypothetical protein
VPQGSLRHEVKNSETGDNDHHDQLCVEGHLRSLIPGGVCCFQDDLRSFLARRQRGGPFGGLGFLRPIDEMLMLPYHPGRLEPLRLVKGLDEAGKVSLERILFSLGRDGGNGRITYRRELSMLHRIISNGRFDDPHLKMP